MKILIVNPSFWIYGGAEHVIVKLANHLTDNYHQCTILTTQMTDSIRRDLKETRLLMCSNLQEMTAVFKQIQYDFDLINFHNDPAQLLSFGSTIPNIWCCNEPPQIWLEHGKIPDDQLNCVKKYIKNVVVADEFNRERFKQIYGMDSNVIPYGIDYDYWQVPRKKEMPYGLKKGFVITQVGFVHPMKNQMATVWTFCEIKKQIPDARLILAGYEVPEYKKMLVEFITKKNKKWLEDVVFTGFVSQEEIRDIYAVTDVAFMPIKTQGSWLSIFEAMASGLPVLVSSDATASQILLKNKIGYVGNYLDTLMMIYKKGGRDDRKWVKSNLSWDRYCKSMEEMMKE